MLLNLSGDVPFEAADWSSPGLADTYSVIV